MFSLESPHEFTQHTIFNVKYKITLNHPNSAAMGFSQENQERLRNSVVNEPSLFDPLMVYCIFHKLKQTELCEEPRRIVQ